MENPTHSLFLLTNAKGGEPVRVGLYVNDAYVTDVTPEGTLPSLASSDAFTWSANVTLCTSGAAVGRTFRKRLEQKGIMLTEPLHRSKELGNVQVAVLTDPWGTVIELTEGLSRP